MARAQPKFAGPAMNTPIAAARQAALSRLALLVDKLDEDEATALSKLSDDDLEYHFKSCLTQAALAKSNRQRPGLEAIIDKDEVLRRREALVREGRLIKPASFLRGLGVTKQALSKAVKSGRMFSLDVGPATYYPAFYLDLEVDRKELQKVTQALGSLPGWSKWQFFTLPKGSLGSRTPLEALAEGMVEDVRGAAHAFAER
ncbi:hypothetical protein [Burkholderia vietnamiensis]|uniref:hypothetical protein n=1 Tax=Burkholderia vietnamiensis TaxID=60552 RepID=UPI001594AC6B|nr:hypothetical protein [Burkholderia vietnamiensis]MCA8070025.1 hypothetical protein [Burkholderia vietnamiensis]